MAIRRPLTINQELEKNLALELDDTEAKILTPHLHSHYSSIQCENGRALAIKNRATYIKDILRHQDTAHVMVIVRARTTTGQDIDVWVLVDEVSQDLTLTGHIDDAIIENDFGLVPGDRVRFHVQNTVKVMITR